MTISGTQLPSSVAWKRLWSQTELLSCGEERRVSVQACWADRVSEGRFRASISARRGCSRDVGTTGMGVFAWDVTVVCRVSESRVVSCRARKVLTDVIGLPIGLLLLVQYRDPQLAHCHLEFFGARQFRMHPQSSERLVQAALDGLDGICNLKEQSQRREYHHFWTRRVEALEQEGQPDGRGDGHGGTELGVREESQTLEPYRLVGRRGGQRLAYQRDHPVKGVISSVIEIQAGSRCGLGAEDWKACGDASFVQSCKLRR
jgi:hypothetical protein